MAFLCGSAGKESACNVGDLGLIPGLGRSLGEGNCYTLEFWPGEFHEQRSLAGYSSWGCKESDRIEQLALHFLPRSKCLLILWLQSPSTVILEPKKIKSVTVSIFSLSICHEVMGLDFLILVFWMLSFKPAFHFPLLSPSKGFLVPLHFLPLEWYHLNIWGY